MVAGAKRDTIARRLHHEIFRGTGKPSRLQRSISQKHAVDILPDVHRIAVIVQDLPQADRHFINAAAYLHRYRAWIITARQVLRLLRHSRTEKTENLIEHLDEIDEQISAHTNAWNLERLGKAELSILRLATYEILLDEQVPRKVAINEAVELAKKYCNEKAAPFINGVLSKIGQDMDEE